MKPSAKGRTVPYTERGISRVECFVPECENRAGSQWQICADGNRYRPVCIQHDILMNLGVVDIMFPKEEADALIDRYTKEKFQ